MPKHRFANQAEQYSDYILGAFGVISAAALFGFIVITIGPDYGEEGLFDLLKTLFSVGETAVPLAAAGAAGAGAVAYGTNQMVDAAKEPLESLKTTEGVALAVVVGLPIVFVFSSTVSGWAEADTLIQGVMTGAYAVSIGHLVHE